MQSARQTDLKTYWKSTSVVCGGVCTESLLLIVFFVTLKNKIIKHQNQTDPQYIGWSLSEIIFFFRLTVTRAARSDRARISVVTWECIKCVGNREKKHNVREEKKIIENLERKKAKRFRRVCKSDCIKNRVFVKSSLVGRALLAVVVQERYCRASVTRRLEEKKCMVKLVGQE